MSRLRFSQYDARGLPKEEMPTGDARSPGGDEEKAARREETARRPKEQERQRNNEDEETGVSN